MTSFCARLRVAYGALSLSPLEGEEEEAVIETAP